MYGRRRMRGNQLCIKGPIADLLIRMLEVPNDSRDISTLGSQHCLRIARPEAVSLECVKVLVSQERRLANALRVQKPKSSLKRCRRRSGFFEQIGIGPV